MKKIIILMFCMIFLVGTISAMDIDNWVTYEKNNTVAVFDNWLTLGKTIARAELLSGFTNYVIRGKDRRVMIFSIENYGDEYINGLKDMEITNMLTSKEEDKDYYYEYAVYEYLEADDYETTCIDVKDLGNGTIEQDCTKKVIGSHIEKKIKSWERLTSTNLPKGNITIALVTDVKRNDHYDGIPILFGKRVNKWAEWTEGLNVNLVASYNFNESEGNLLNAISTDWYGIVEEISAREITQASPSGINEGYRFDGTNDYINITNNASGQGPIGSANGTISIWFNATFDSNESVGQRTLMYSVSQSAFGFVITPTTYGLHLFSPSACHVPIAKNEWWNAGEWTNIVITWDDATNVCEIYIIGLLNRTEVFAFTIAYLTIL